MKGQRTMEEIEMMRKVKTLLFLGMMMVATFAGLVFVPMPVVQASFSGTGTGIPGDPYMITNINQLQEMRDDLAAHYALANDIYASVTEGWNSGAGFEPVGNWENPFMGSLDGCGYTITNLYINRPDADSVGLFGFVSFWGEVKNVGVIDSNVKGLDSVGGLVGENWGLVSNSYTTGNTSGGWNSVGGLVGYNTGSVSNSYTTGNTSGGWNSVGGLVGYNTGSVSNSYTKGNTTGDRRVGGLIGENCGSVSNSHYNIDEVLINGGHYVTLGGLFDAQYKDWFSSGMALDIADYNTTLVPTSEYYEIGTTQGLRDLLGFATIELYKFRLTADLDFSSSPGLHIPYFAAGEFDGDNHTISNMYVNMPFAFHVSMFGYNKNGAIKNIGIMNADMTGENYVGGLVGHNYGSVSNSYATGDVSGKWYVGGLVGHNYGSVNNSYATGNVNGGTWVGGLVGYNNGPVSNSYATGDTTGTGSNVGGLVGNNGGSINNNYATGNTTGSNRVGGLVGNNDGSVSNNYATGNTTGTEWGVGGLVGNNDGSVNNSFYDRETTGQSDDAGKGIPKTTAEMMTKTTFTSAGWDFDNIWHMIENETYPLFQRQPLEEQNGLGVDYVVISPAPVASVVAGVSLAFTAEAYNSTYGLVSSDPGDFFWQNASNGVFAQILVGTYHVTASLDDVISNTTVVTVTPGDAYTIAIVPTPNTTTEAGMHVNFTAEARDQHGNLITDNVTDFTWTNAINGIFLKTATGTYHVTAQYDSATSPTTTVTVVPGPTTSVEISPAPTATVQTGLEILFTAHARDQYGNLITVAGGDFTWHGADANGVFSSGTPGVSEVTATYDGVSSPTTMVTVVDYNIDHIIITISPNGTPIALHAKLVGTTLTAYASAYNDTVGYMGLVEVNWMAMGGAWAPTTGTSSVFTAGTTAGTYEQVAANATLEMEYRFNITVTPESVAVVTLTPASNANVAAGVFLNFTVVARDQHGNLVTDNVSHFTWTGAINGSFRETIVGNYNVTATHGTVTSDTTVVTAVPNTVVITTISPAPVDAVAAGVFLVFTAEARDAYGNLITDDVTDFSWTNAVDGVFNEEAVGDYSVTATHGTVTSDTTVVTVVPGPVEVIIINTTSLTVETEIGVVFTAESYDIYGNLITDNVEEFTWTNATGGVFNKTEAGTYNVIAELDGVSSAPIAITVTDVEDDPDDEDDVDDEYLGDGDVTTTKDKETRSLLFLLLVCIIIMAAVVAFFVLLKHKPTIPKKTGEKDTASETPPSPEEPPVQPPEDTPIE